MKNMWKKWNIKKIEKDGKRVIRATGNCGGYQPKEPKPPDDGPGIKSNGNVSQDR